MAEPAVLYGLRENIAVLTLNRPHRLNAINMEMLTQLVGRLDDARQDSAVSCAILTGTGRAFCSGEDLKETAAGKTLEAWEREVAGLQEVQRAVMRLGKPLIAAVRGYAVGGGCEFAMSCDIRIASDDARFGFPETAVGMTVTTAGTKLLSHLVGLGKAKELVFTGEFIDAEEAARIGLVNRVVPGDRLMDEAIAMAGKIAERSPLALRLSRTAIEEGLHSTFEQALELEAGQILECVQEGSYIEYAKKTAKGMGKGRR
ncbi:MAG: enoyl-CoA hydratase/isomerase family protein [Chloroflexi bacterium]|nr:enoyl-CoA hydratase/isomerase family protein [Chloroflexota bacterium]